MDNKRKLRSDTEWMEMITVCRASGLSDKAWCDQKNIPLSTFYNAVHRLRKKAYQIPSQTADKNVIDLTAANEVVKINIVDEESAQTALVPESTTHLDNPYTVEILIGSATIRLSNSADPKMAGSIIRMIGGAYAG